MAALLALLPDEVLYLIPFGLGFLVMLRLLSLGRALGILLAFAAIIALLPFVSSLLDRLPLWLLILVVIFFGYSLLRALTGVALGKGVSDQFFGMILHDVFLMPFRIVRWIFQMIFRRART